MGSAHVTDRPEILCVGRVYADLVFAGLNRLPSLGTEIFSDGLSLHPGGGAANSAATLVALGQRAHLIATLPAAPFGGPLTERLRAIGINIDFCTAARPGDAPQITMALSLADDRAFVTHRVGAACARFDPAVLPQVGHLHIGELKTLEEDPWLIDLARDAGWTLSLDCGWDDGLMARGAEVAHLIEAVDVFLPNQAEWQALCDSGLVMGKPPLVAVKCGGDGAFALVDGARVEAAARPTEVVDPTGAGDAFAAGFVVAWRQGRALLACLELGNDCGARAVAVMGGAGGIGQIDAGMHRAAE
nr:carbohydrate kinase family protein [Phaeobacter sp. J2-8]